MGHKLGDVAVSLAGGAAKGLGNLGALKALEEHGVRPCAIAGTSAGALIGGLYASGKSIAELEGILYGLSQTHVRKLVDLTWARGSLVAGKRVEEFLYDIVGDIRIEDMPIPFTASAVDVLTGRGYHFDRGPLVDAIRASISVPGIFEPVAANGGYLVDGGIRMNLPLEVLHAHHPDTLIGINITPRYSGTREWERAEIQRSPGDEDEGISLWERLRGMVQKTADSKLTRGSALHAMVTPDEPGSSKKSVKSQSRSSSAKSDARDEPPGTAYLLSRVFELVMYEASQAECERAAPDFVVDVDMQEIEVWEFWRGKDAVALGYSQTKDALEKYMAERGVRSWWRTRARRLARQV